MSKLKATPLRNCESCGEEYGRNVASKESAAHFLKRKYCGSECASAGLALRKDRPARTGDEKLTYAGGTTFPRELVLRMHELEQAGYTRGQVVKELGVGYDNLRRYLGVRGDPYSRARAIERYDPYIDDIAVEQAYRGRRRAWERLTLFELDEVRKLLHARRIREPFTSHHCDNNNPYWLDSWAKSVGENVKSIAKWIDREVADQGEVRAA